MNELKKSFHTVSFRPVMTKQVVLFNERSSRGYKNVVLKASFEDIVVKQSNARFLPHLMKAGIRTKACFAVEKADKASLISKVS